MRDDAYPRLEEQCIPRATAGGFAVSVLHTNSADTALKH